MAQNLQIVIRNAIYITLIPSKIDYESTISINVLSQMNYECNINAPQTCYESSIHPHKIDFRIYIKFLSQN